MDFVEVLIADDHDWFRRAIRTVIESEAAYRVCGEARDGIDAVDKVRQLHPDIVLMDINMPGWTVYKQRRSFGGRFLIAT
jgi:DNA-binding NarL/FixJ family response regulator